MNAWKIILATMVIFGTGVITGGLLVRNSHRMWSRPIWQAPQQPRPVTPAATGSLGGSRLEFLRRAERDLRLTPDQRQQVDEILRGSQERIKKTMEGVTPKIRDEVQRASEEFRAVLTPPQRERMDELLKQQRARDQRRSGSAGHREKSGEGQAGKAAREPQH